MIGPNGAGKTTLFNMLSGIYTPDEGSIRFRDREIVGRPLPHKVAELGVSDFQNLQMFFNMSVLDNVKVGCHLRTKSRLWNSALRLPGTRREEKQAELWAREALHFCGLDKYLQLDADALPMVC